MFGAVSPEFGGAIFGALKSSSLNPALSRFLQSVDVSQDYSRAALGPMAQALSAANHTPDSLQALFEKDPPAALQAVHDAWRTGQAKVFKRASEISGAFISPDTNEAGLASSLQQMSQLQKIYPGYFPPEVAETFEPARIKAADRLQAMQLARAQAEVGSTTKDWRSAPDQTPGDSPPPSDEVKRTMGDLLAIGNEATSLQHLEGLAKSGSQADQLFIADGLTGNFQNLAYRFGIGADIVGVLERLGTTTPYPAVRLAVIKKMLDRCVVWTKAVGLINYRNTLASIANVAASSQSDPAVKQQAVLWLEANEAQTETMTQGDSEFVFALVKKIRQSAGLDVPPQAP
jgi:hypothetical protein